MEKYTLNKAIETMTEIASNPSPMAASLFTAQDVLRILNSIEPEPTNRANIPAEWQDHFLDILLDNLDESDLIDYDSAEFSIRYSNELQLDNCGLDMHRLKRELRDQIAYACDEVNSEITFQEEREAEEKAAALEEANSNNESEANDENNESSN